MTLHWYYQGQDHRIRQDLCYQVNPFLFPQHFEKVLWLSWFWTFWAWSLSPPVQTWMVSCSSNESMTFLWWHPKASFLWVLSSPVACSLPQLPEQCVLRCPSAIFSCFVAIPCLLLASEIDSLWKMIQFSEITRFCVFHLIIVLF